MSGAKDYERDFERMMGDLEAKDSLLEEKSVRSVKAWIEENRKAVGMTPKEMYSILEMKGVEELVEEINRRLAAKNSATQI